MVKFEESLDTGIINNWISTMVSEDHKKRDIRRASQGSQSSLKMLAIEQEN